MKILELTHYTAGICGVWARVRQESLELTKRGHNVLVLSSNATKGSTCLACSNEKIQGVKIIRFPFKKLGGEGFLSWNFEREAIKFNPDVIIAHSYRQLHTARALEVAKVLKRDGLRCKVFLVTHAPFERNRTRSFISRIVVWSYDKLIAKEALKKFDRIIAISKWEIPYIKKLGVPDKKIVYIPNGISNEFFKTKKTAKEENKMLFIGRISPVKSLETVISAIPLIGDKKIILEIVGPAETGYLAKLKDLIKLLKVENRVIFSRPIYDNKEKIRKIDSASLFVLPSKNEGMPQALIEAMSRGKIVIGSNNIAIRDIISDNENGYCFDFGNSKSLAEKIGIALEKTKKNKKIREKARNFVEQFEWAKITDKIEKLFY